MYKGHWENLPEDKPFKTSSRSGKNNVLNSISKLWDTRFNAYFFIPK